MQSYGKIVNEELVFSTIEFEGYKPIVYAEIPEGFDQTTQYVTQLAPVEEVERIYIGVEVHNLDLTEYEGEIFDGEQPI